MFTNGNRITAHMPREATATSAAPTFAEVSKSGEQLLKTAQVFIRERPVACLAGAFATGMVIAWFIKRTR